MSQDLAIERAGVTPEQWEIVAANQGLIGWTINKWFGDFDKESGDMFGDGVFGLIRAAQLFDPATGFKFSTYATFWIRQAIARGAEVRLGANYRSAHRAGRDYQSPVSLDGMTNSEGEPFEFVSSGEDVAADVVQAQLVTEIQALLFLEARDDLDLAAIETLTSGRPFHEIATQAGVSRESLRRRRTALVERVRRHMTTGDHPEGLGSVIPANGARV